MDITDNPELLATFDGGGARAAGLARRRAAGARGGAAVAQRHSRDSSATPTPSRARPGCSGCTAIVELAHAAEDILPARARPAPVSPAEGAHRSAARCRRRDDAQPAGRRVTAAGARPRGAARRPARRPRGQAGRGAEPAHASRRRPPPPHRRGRASRKPPPEPAAEEAPVPVAAAPAAPVETVRVAVRAGARPARHRRRGGGRCPPRRARRQRARDRPGSGGTPAGPAFQRAGGAAAGSAPPCASWSRTTQPGCRGCAARR